MDEKAQCEVNKPVSMVFDAAKLIVAVKELRRDIDAIIQRVRGDTMNTRETEICLVRLTEAVMWLGMELKRLGTPNPYPDSKDPSNTKINPTADGLKL